MKKLLERFHPLRPPRLRLLPSSDEDLARLSLAEARAENRFYVHLATWAAWTAWFLALNLLAGGGCWSLFAAGGWGFWVAVHGYRLRGRRRRYEERHRALRDEKRRASQDDVLGDVEHLRQRFLTASDEARGVLRAANPKTGAQLTRGEGEALASISWLADAGRLLARHRLDPQLRRSLTHRLSEPTTQDMPAIPRDKLVTLLGVLDRYDGKLAELESSFETRRARLESFLLALENVKMADAGAGLPPAVAASLKRHVGLLAGAAPAQPPDDDGEDSAVRIREEVRLAQDLQRSILPEAAPDVPGLRVAHLYCPWSEVGGDFYDFYSPAPGRLLVALGDASGHGLDSSMISSMAKSALYLQVSARSGLAESLVEINRMMCDTLGRRRLMTLALLAIDTEQRSLRWVNAGQVYPLLRRGGEVRELVQPGYPLGVRREMTYAAREEKLEAGDLLVLVTDGYVEAAGDGGEPYGWERLYERLRNVPTNDPEDAVGLLATDLTNHLGSAPAQDDVTMIAIACEP